MVDIVYQDDTTETKTLNADKTLFDINVTNIKEIHFQNYYTPIANGNPTGHFVIIKTDKDEPTKTLQNAEFTLTTEDNIKTSAISDSNGLVYFNNLIPGTTYTLTETKAPDGYELSKNTWTVTVIAHNETSDIQVIIKDNANTNDNGDICYTNNTLTKYNITNTAAINEPDNPDKPDKPDKPDNTQNDNQDDKLENNKIDKTPTNIVTETTKPTVTTTVKDVETSDSSNILPSLIALLSSMITFYIISKMKYKPKKTHIHDK